MANYRVVGIDNREYGPAPDAQIAQWIREGRVTGASLCQKEGEPAWRPLSSYPEFDAAFQERSAGAPGALTPMPGSGIPSSMEGGLDIGAVIGRAWDVYSGDFWVLLGVHALAGLLISVLSSVGLGLFLNGHLIAGLFMYDLRRLRGESAKLDDIFAPFSTHFVPLLIASIIIQLLITLGLTLCIIPGVYLWVAWAFAYPIVVEHGVDFWPAMELSRTRSHSCWWELLGLKLLLVVLALVGLALCGVGWFLVFPLQMIALAVAYEKVIGRPSTVNPV